MDYPLCKKLKDVGFPQVPAVDAKYIRRTGRAPVYICEHHRAHYKCPTHTEVYVPHLRELIDACGEVFINVEKMADGKWWASKKNEFFTNDGVTKNSGEATYTIGSTPEEAVANLWLKLNGK